MATCLGNGKVLVTGGASAGTVLKSAELFDPATDPKGDWSKIEPMGEERLWHTATLLSDGNVLVAGGRNGAGQYRTKTELYV